MDQLKGSHGNQHLDKIYYRYVICILCDHKSYIIVIEVKVEYILKLIEGNIECNVVERITHVLIRITVYPSKYTSWIKIQNVGTKSNF